MKEATLISKLNKAEGRNEEILILVSAGWKYAEVAQALELKSIGTVSGVIDRQRKIANRKTS